MFIHLISYSVLFLPLNENYHRTAGNNDGKDGEEYDLFCGAFTRRSHVVWSKSTIYFKSKQRC